jgi:hypothetical protein
MSKKITDLTSLTTPDSADVVPVVDVSANTTKKTTVGGIHDAMPEAFFRGRRQLNTTNDAPTGLTVQFGWGFIQGDSTADINESITFPVAFSSPPVVICSALGKRTSAPTDIDDLDATTASTYGAQMNSITTSGADVYLRVESGSTFNNTHYFGYSWIAIGPV